MKKLFLLTFSILLLFSLAACGDNAGEDTSATPDGTPPGETQSAEPNPGNSGGADLRFANITAEDYDLQWGGAGLDKVMITLYDANIAPKFEAVGGSDYHVSVQVYYSENPEDTIDFEIRPSYSEENGKHYLEFDEFCVNGGYLEEVDFDNHKMIIWLQGDERLVKNIDRATVTVNATGLSEELSIVFSDDTLKNAPVPDPSALHDAVFDLEVEKLTSTTMRFTFYDSTIVPNFRVEQIPFSFDRAIECKTDDDATVFFGASLSAAGYPSPEIPELCFLSEMRPTQGAGAKVLSFECDVDKQCLIWEVEVAEGVADSIATYKVYVTTTHGDDDVSVDYRK